MNPTTQVPDAEAPVAIRTAASKLGVWAAVLTTACTVVMAVMGIATPARSGPFCATWGCVAYPYTDVAQFIPGDYLWLIPGILLALLFVVLMACIHAFALEGRKLFSRLALLSAGPTRRSSSQTILRNSPLSSPVSRPGRPQVSRCSRSITRTGSSSRGRCSAIY